jgi:hypothetical protein
VAPHHPRAQRRIGLTPRSPRRRPGKGWSCRTIGRIEYSLDEEGILFIAGHHFEVPGGDFVAVFCAALAQAIYIQLQAIARRLAVAVLPP